jgi:hypothetical protein
MSIIFWGIFIAFFVKVRYNESIGKKRAEDPFLMKKIRIGGNT